MSSFSFLEFRGDPVVGSDTATLAGFCIEGFIGVGDTVQTVFTEGGFVDTDLTVLTIDRYGSDIDRFPGAAKITVGGSGVQGLVAGAILCGDNRFGPTGDGDVPIIASPGSPPGAFGFTQMGDSPRIDPGSATLSGKGSEGVIRVGDRFRFVMRPDGQVSDVDLAVTDIGFYGQYISELEPGLVAQLTVIGDTVDLIAPRTILWGENRGVVAD